MDGGITGGSTNRVGRQVNRATRGRGSSAQPETARIDVLIEGLAGAARRIGREAEPDEG
jgi:hypothetical protein